MKKFTLGAITGMASLAVAVPIIAQVSLAQSDSSAPASVPEFSIGGGPSDMMFTRPAMTAEHLQDMIARDEAFLANADDMLVALKDATQDRKDALSAAASLTDETARNEAVKAAMDAFHTAMKETFEANSDWNNAMSMGPMGFGMGGHMMKMHGGPGHGPKGAHLAEKLGMTEEELKAAIESGKTIEQIAEEKGVELPIRIHKFMHTPFETNMSTSGASSVQ